MIEFMYVFLLGVFSILSPCTFVIIPVMASETDSTIRRFLLFFAGLLITFSALGIAAALTGKLLTSFMGAWFYILAGAITLISGLVMLGVLNINIPGLIGTTKRHNPFVMGLIYGGVVLACIGPLLASVLVLITVKATISAGLMYMLIFGLGFAAPFLLFGIIITDKTVVARLARHTPNIRKAGGILLLIAASYLFFIASRGVL